MEIHVINQTDLQISRFFTIPIFLQRFLFLLLIAAVVVSSQEYPSPPAPTPAPTDDNTIGSLGVQLITQFLTGDFVKRKIQLLFDIIDLKARLIYAITSFCTTDNLIALKRFLDWVCRFATFLNQFLPTMPEENPKTALLGLVLNMFNNFVSPPPTEAPTLYLPQQVDNTPPPLVYSPPPYYESVQVNDINNNYNQSEAAPELSSNVKRSLEPQQEVEAKQDEPKLSDLSEDEIRKMLKNKDGVFTLSKLISSAKR
ncbi:uncharacterized protein LOC123321150 [Coccinella septempunctata]|uniref:uncharacterized protein LOC123321150 n=1 Tax=Coccinella septempunctata TaxID=41139 RepID=UPI001D06AD70|nr:uncharacterized protein LOC123321150 [Coccinella septempunctata]